MDKHEAAAGYLLDAKADRSKRGAGLPEAMRPQTRDDAYAIQRAIIAHLGTGVGAIGGWKVGSPSPTSDTFTCAPIPRGNIVDSPAITKGSDRVVEAEIAVCLAADLPTRATPYTDAEIRGAIASAHPAIEVLESRFADPDQVDPLSGLADSLAHYSLVIGPAIDGWETLDLTQEQVGLLIDGREIKRCTGNPGGDVIRLVRWLANTGARWAGGLEAGQVVTTGSWTAKDLVPLGAEARIRFDRCGEASTRFVS